MNKRVTIKGLFNTKKNRLNIDSKKWGERAWEFSFASVLSYPEHPTDEEINDAKNYFTSFRSMLPCFNCRNNYVNHLDDYPLTDEVLSNRTNLTKWLVDIKNLVNESLGLPTYSYDETVSYYYNQLNKPKGFCWKNLIDSYGDDNIVKITILISILLFLVYYLAKH